MRERIAINSAPLSETLFAQYFFDVWDALKLSRNVEFTEYTYLTRPTYFRFLTLLCFHVFLRESVDAAIVEVGVGGTWDTTNIIEKPVATGVTALGIDHVQTLGSTLGEIARHKGGIFKSGTPAFSVPQANEGRTVLAECAAKKGLDLQVVEASPDVAGLRLAPAEPFQWQNATLAVALADLVLQKAGQPSLYSNVGLSELAKQALERTVWRGRFETMESKGARWYLDGAHTEESLRLTAKWFATAAASA